MGYMDGEYYNNAASSVHDSSLQAFCLTAYDGDSDGKLSQEEAAGVTKIDCSGQGITTLAGIKAFPALDTLICDNNRLQWIPFSEMPNLRSLSCKGNRITELDIRGTRLGTLRCNPMNDDTGNNLLEFVYLSRGQSLDVLDVPDDTYVIEMP